MAGLKGVVDRVGNRGLNATQGTPGWGWEVLGGEMSKHNKGRGGYQVAHGAEHREGLLGPASGRHQHGGGAIPQPAGGVPSPGAALQCCPMTLQAAR